MEELIERLKFIPLSRRLIVAAIVGLVFPWYFIFMDELENLEYEKETATSALEAIQVKFNRAKSQKNDFPELEKKLAFTQDQLKKAKTRLPDEYHMDSILEFVAVSSDEAGVQLQEFTPQKEEFRDTGYSYVEMPINLKVEGNYNQVGVFFDKLAHMEKMIHLRDLHTKQISKIPAANEIGGELSKQAKLAQALDRIKVVTTGKLVVFRSARPGEGAGEAL